MFSLYYTLLMSHIVSSEWYYGNKENVGRLMSQRKIAYYDLPQCELPESEWSKHYDKKSIACSTDLKGYYIGKCVTRYLYFDDAEYTTFTSEARCGCQPNGECPFTLRSNPCIPIDKSYPMQERATFTSNGTKALEWSGLAYPLEYREENQYETSPPKTSNVVGVAKQDVQEGKYLQMIIEQYVKDHFTKGLHSFTLIVRNDGDSSYTKAINSLVAFWFSDENNVRIWNICTG